MATTYELIASQTLGSTASSVTFSSIPSTYDDLHLVVSARTNSTSGDGFLPLYVRFNSDSGSNYSYRTIQATGSTAASGNGSGETNLFLSYVPGAVGTSNTFGSHSAYIPNYAGSSAKSVSIDATTENNATLNYLAAIAALWSGTSAISSIEIRVPFDPFIANSSFHLYGITKA